MAGTRERGREIRRFIVGQAAAHPEDVAQVAAARFGISRQAVNKHLGSLVAEGLLTAHGATRNRRYEVAVLDRKEMVVPLANETEEDQVWRRDVEPFMADLPGAALKIWQYGFTGMLNNAMDHSSGTRVWIVMERTAVDARIRLIDDGEAIFHKIARDMQLDDERHAVLELAKGKLTTDPERHTGEGIFFTSRLFDRFALLSHGVFFPDDDATRQFSIQETVPISDGFVIDGTAVFLELNNDTERTLKQVFDEYTTDGDYGFSKTVVPVRLVQYGNEALVSRSQAKRLLARLDRFKTVVLDFEGVEQIGQGFADELFRVFVRAHPNVEIVPARANPQVNSMIRRAQSTT